MYMSITAYLFFAPTKFTISLEQFSVEFLRSKTRAIPLWPITIEAHNSINQLELNANTDSRRQARENACEKDTTIGFAFASDWLRKWREIFF